MTFSILTVCTGNVCRSPLAERLLAAGLERRFPGGDCGVAVASAGTGALVGQPMTEQTAAIVSRHGGDPAAHAARALTASLVDEADLVLAMTRRHRGAVVTLVPRATRRTFTLREAARLASLVAPGDLPEAALQERLRALVPALAARRGLVPVEDPADDDVVDPYRRPEEVYRRMAEQLVPAVEALLQVTAR